MRKYAGEKGAGGVRVGTDITGEGGVVVEQVGGGGEEGLIRYFMG